MTGIEIRAERSLDKHIRKFNGENYRLDAWGITTGEREAVRLRSKMRKSDGFKTRIVKGANGDLKLFIKLKV